MRKYRIIILHGINVLMIIINLIDLNMKLRGKKRRKEKKRQTSGCDCEGLKKKVMEGGGLEK